MPEPESLTDEMVDAKWREIAPLIEVMMNRTQSPNEFVVQPNSELATDDEASNPYQISQAARWCLNAGVEHLHALKSLVIDAGLIHSNASYSLVRGALENFGAGFWILHPTEPSIRIEHGLRWWMKNARDQDKATSDLALPNYKPLQPKLLRIVEVGKAAGCNEKGLNDPYFSTPVLQYATKHSTASNPFLIWQVCSGFAHGRPWASLGMNEMEKNGETVDGVSLVRLTADHKRLLAVTLPAFRLLTDLVRLTQDRSKAADE